MTDRIVVVGAGQAGAALATRLRTLGFTGRLTLIGEEPALPYQRPPLSKKYLLGMADLDRLLLRPSAYYVENGIEMLTGITVRGIDRSARTLRVDGETDIGFDLLALTTGARPRRLPAALGGSLDGVYTLRTIADVGRMAFEFRAGRHALVLGGGFIGLEAAAIAAERGLRVTLLELAPRILNRVVAAETASFFRGLHTNHGVDLREGTGLARLEGEAGRVTGAILANGERLPVDFVVVGIGVDPDIGLASETGLHVDNGIAVDERCRTSEPSIFAAGDCTAFPWRGGRIRLESVQNAIDQAEHTASAMLGSDAPYRPHPWFWSDQFDFKLQIAGLNTGHDRVVVRKGTRSGGQSVWYFRQGQMLAVDAMNDPRAFMQGKRWLELGVTPDLDEIVLPDSDLRSVPTRVAA